MLADAIAFFRRYIEDEYAARVAVLCEPDDQKFEALQSLVNSYFEGMDSTIGRPPGIPPSEFQSPQREKQRESTTARPLFLVKRQSEPRLGELCSGYFGIGLTLPRGEALNEDLYARRGNDGFKIVSRYLLCINCRGTGCHECESRGWTNAGGLELKDLGPPLEIEKLEPPVRGREIYDALKVA